MGQRIPSGRQQFSQALAQPFVSGKLQAQDSLPELPGIKAKAARPVERWLILRGTRRTPQRTNQVHGGMEMAGRNACTEVRSTAANSAQQARQMRSRAPSLESSFPQRSKRWERQRQEVPSRNSEGVKAAGMGLDSGEKANLAGGNPKIN
jgi:hypothetical protein